MSWVGWSRQRLYTNEVSHHRPRIPLSMPSSKTRRISPCSRARDKDIISELPRCSKPSFLRRLKDSQNCWHITTLKQVSLNRLLAIGIKLVNAPSKGQHMWKLLRTFVKGLSCADR